MFILTLLLVGFLVGAVARLLMPGRPGGVVTTIAVGLGGSMLAGFAGRALGWYHGPYSTLGIVASILGAMLVLALFGVVVRGRGGHAR